MKRTLTYVEHTGGTPAWHHLAVLAAALLLGLWILTLSAPAAGQVPRGLLGGLRYTLVGSMRGASKHAMIHRVQPSSARRYYQIQSNSGDVPGISLLSPEQLSTRSNWNRRLRDDVQTVRMQSNGSSLASNTRMDGDIDNDGVGDYDDQWPLNPLRK